MILIDSKELMRQLGIRKTTLTLMLKEGTVPKPMRPTGKRGDLRWPQEQINGWLAGLREGGE